MKSLTINFTDDEFCRLTKAKLKVSSEQGTNYTWHRLFIEAVAKGISFKYRKKEKK